LILVLGGILTAVVPDATFARGPNDPATECLIQLQGNDESPLSGNVTCTDGAECDSDGATNGECQIGVRACVNVPGVSGCTPQALKSAKVTPRSLGINVTASGSSSACGAFSDVGLKLKKKGTKPSKKKNITGKAKAEAKGNLDVDKAKVQCVPCSTESCVPTTTTTIAAVTTTSTSSSTTTTTLACGNGEVTGGEACDPDAPVNGCDGGTPFCNADCTACQADCTSLGFAIATDPQVYCGFPGQGDPAIGDITGDVFDDMSMVIPNGSLAAGCLYIGGGLANQVPPGPTPEGSETIFGVTDCSGDALTLGPSAANGDSRSCSTGPKTTKRCINGHPGTDGLGLCDSDANCAPLCINKACSGGTNDGTTCAADGECTGGGVCRGTCVNGPGNLAGNTCGGDNHCGLGTTANVCHPEPQCFFGAPLAFDNSGNSTCVINVIQDGAAGTATKSTGEAEVTVPLQSRVYLTGVTYGVGRPCPACATVCAGGSNDGQICTGAPDCPAGTCGTSPVCNAGQRKGQACTTANSQLTTHDCPPDSNLFLAPLSVTLQPLTTGTASLTSDASGFFCPGQSSNAPGSEGAFGLAGGRRIEERGAPAAGPLSVTPQDATLGSTFCIPATNNSIVDFAANLPGPGATALAGQVRLR
jgi:hypothetical protein